MNIDLVRGDDWEGIYLDGFLQLENHSLRLSDVLELLMDQQIDGFHQHTADEEWLEERGRLPENLSEVQLAEEDR
jgi:hypothetical protein